MQPEARADETHAEILARQRHDLARDLMLSRIGNPSLRGNIRRELPFGHIIRSFVKDGVQYQLHATKGLRKRRARAA